MNDYTPYRIARWKNWKTFWCWLRGWHNWQWDENHYHCACADCELSLTQYLTECSWYDGKVT